jgi:nucleoside-diphosphate-sugar epimerase
MRVFVAGATGVIGRRLLPRLAQAGHTVTGMTRSPGKAHLVASLGARPVVCDVYDRERLMRTVGRTSSEVVIHLLTDLPARLNPRATTASTDRIRREGTRNLLDAARAAGARRFVAESIAFVYRPSGDGRKSEADPLWLDAPGPLAETAGAVLDLEERVLAAPLDGVVLRLGWLYGPGTWYEPAGSIGRDVQRRLHPIIGQGRGTWSFVHVDDAARAVASGATEGGAGVYNVVDDDPAPIRCWLPVFAEAIGAPKPWRAPRWLARLIAGRAAVEVAERLAGASNARARRSLRWTPQYASWRDGFAKLGRQAG